MASGDALCVWRPMDNEPPDEDFATLDSLLTVSADEPDDIVPMLDFDPGTPNEHAVFAGVMPSHYGGNGVTLTLVWTSQATTGNVKWDAAMKAYTDGLDNLDTKAYATEQSATVTTDSNARDVSYSDILLTDGAQMDNLLANDHFRVRITRDAADSADTMNSNDAELLAVYLRET